MDFITPRGEPAADIGKRCALVGVERLQVVPRFDVLRGVVATIHFDERTLNQTSCGG
jgi:hypothetical protein